MTSTWGRSQERNSFGTFKSLERNRLLVIAWQQHIFWKTTCGMVMWKQSRLSHQHVCYHPTSLRSGVILPGHSTLSSCHLVSGSLLTAHVRQAQLLSSALAFALLRSDGTVATWGTLVLVQFHGDCLMVSELLSPWSCYGKKKTSHPGHDGFFLAEAAASIPDAQEHLRNNCLTWNNMDSICFC